MMKSICGLFVSALLGIGLGVVGCGGGDLDPGLPKDTGYVPLPADMQPNMGAGVKKPVMGATEKERQEVAKAAAAAEAASAKNPTPK